MHVSMLLTRKHFFFYSNMQNSAARGKINKGNFRCERQRMQIYDQKCIFSVVDKIIKYLNLLKGVQNWWEKKIKCVHVVSTSESDATCNNFLSHLSKTWKIVDTYTGCRIYIFYNLYTCLFNLNFFMSFYQYGDYFQFYWICKLKNWRRPARRPVSEKGSHAALWPVLKE